MILYASNGEWVAFTSEGAPALKGNKKRDGPLWALEGGLNNPSDEVPQMHVEDESVKARGKKPRRQAGGGWDDEGMPTGGRRKRGRRQQNAYQSKRGVEVTASLVGFAGSTWCSSYYLCPIELDGSRYTSSAHCVMVTQARLFCDEERAEELMELGKDSAPHKAFDHTAPKTGKRKVKNFDLKIWERCRIRIMFRATYAKFW